MSEFGISHKFVEHFIEVFYVHVTVHRNKFLYNKTNQMHQFHKFTPARNSTCFGQFLCPSAGVYSLYTRHWYISYGLKTAFEQDHPGPARKLSSNRMIYTSAACTVNKLLTMGRGTARNVEFRAGVNLGNWCIWLVLL